MKKRKIMGVMAFIMALCLVWTTCLPGVRAAEPSAADRYNEGYDISSILSQFQFFVSGDVTLNSEGHTVGAVVAGGELNIANVFGNAAIVPSYIGNLKSISGFGDAWIDDRCDTVYYGDGSAAYLGGKWIKNPNYINITEAFKTIQEESSNLADNSKKINAKDGVVTIDCTGTDDLYVFLDYDTFTNSTINFVVDSVDWFSKHVCCVSVIGVDDKTVNYYGEGGSHGDSHIFVKVKSDTEVIGHALEKMSNTYKDLQYNPGGMNLVWNFPDAKGTIEVVSLGGHLVAPNASVNLNGSNYEGGIIAKSLSGGAEGHFYPMKGKLKSVDSEDSSTATTTEKGSTATTASEKTTATTASEKTTATTASEKTTATTASEKTTATTASEKTTATTASEKTTATTASEKTTATTTEKKTTQKKTTEKKTTETSTEKPSTKVGGMEVQVQDEKTKEPVPNAKVQITYPDGRRDVCTTDENGTITKKGLTPGEYTVTVIEVPEGYTVTTGKEETVTVEAGKTTKHVVKIKTATGAQTDNTQGTDTATATNTVATSQSVDASSSNAAKTGDSVPVAMLVLILTGAAATMLILGYSKKRYE